MPEQTENLSGQNAKIHNNRVIVWSDEIKDPVCVRYAWADNPEGANLYNIEGLPASPFEACPDKQIIINLLTSHLTHAFPVDIFKIDFIFFSVR